MTADGGTTYTYDENGNRSGGLIQIGSNNRLLRDAAGNTYGYDDEGNCLWKQATDGSRVEYAWDYRNRLTSVTFKDENGVPTKTVSYTYDAFNRWIGETIVEDETTTQTRYVYDGNEVIAQFDKSGTGDLTAANLSHRYLWDAQSVDHLFADETTGWNSTAERSVTADLLWALVDHQNSVRDLARYNAGTDTTAVVDHRVFDAYGKLVSDSNSAIDSLFGYTGRAHDAATGLQNNHNRWYDSITGRWLSQDPAGFSAGDANLYRYVGNNPSRYVDPSGLCRGGLRGMYEAPPRNEWGQEHDIKPGFHFNPDPWDPSATATGAFGNATGTIGANKDGLLGGGSFITPGLAAGGQFANNGQNGSVFGNFGDGTTQGWFNGSWGDNGVTGHFGVQGDGFHGDASLANGVGTFTGGIGSGSTLLGGGFDTNYNLWLHGIIAGKTAGQTTIVITGWGFYTPIGGQGDGTQSPFIPSTPSSSPLWPDSNPYAPPAGPRGPGGGASGTVGGPLWNGHWSGSVGVDVILGPDGKPRFGWCAGVNVFVPLQPKPRL